MTADVNWRPGLWPPQVWEQFALGYDAGLASGIEIGYRNGFTDGEFAEAARKGPITNQPDEIDAAFALVAAKKAARRAETAPRPLSPAEIRARAEASWAAVEQQINRRAS